MGASVNGWYAVLSGLVKLQSTSPEGRVSAFLGVPGGEWFGEGSVLKAESRRYDVIALRDTTLLCLPRADFESLQTSSLAFNQYLVAHLNRRLGQAMALIEAGRLRSPEERVALYLSRVFWPGTRKLSLSQEELGHLVRPSRQTVNRCCARWSARAWCHWPLAGSKYLRRAGAFELPPGLETAANALSVQVCCRLTTIRP